MFFKALGALLPSVFICASLVTLPRPTSELSKETLPLPALSRDKLPLPSFASVICAFLRLLGALLPSDLICASFVTLAKPTSDLVVFAFFKASGASTLLPICVVPFFSCTLVPLKANERSSFLTSSSPNVLLPESFRLVPAVAPSVAPASIPPSFVPVPLSKESRSDRPTLVLLNDWLLITVDPFFNLNVVLPVKSISKSEFLISSSPKVLLPLSFMFVPAVAPKVAPLSTPLSFVS